MPPYYAPPAPPYLGAWLLWAMSKLRFLTPSYAILSLPKVAESPFFDWLEPRDVGDFTGSMNCYDRPLLFKLFMFCVDYFEPERPFLFYW